MSRPSSGSDINTYYVFHENRQWALSGAPYQWGLKVPIGAFLYLISKKRWYHRSAVGYSFIPDRKVPEQYRAMALLVS